MTWYHVTITQKSTNKVEVGLDFSLEDLQQRIVEPRTKGLPITISGKSITPDDIERITITKTDQNSAHIQPGGQLNPLARSLKTRRVVDIYVANSGEDVTNEFITGPPGTDSRAVGQSTTQSQPSTATRTVFVVHGRNEEARKAVFAFLRSIGLDPLEWSRAVQSTGKATPYIGEILDAAFSRAHAVVVLFTPDDEAWLREPYRSASDPAHESVLSGQARPNVLFEAGMAMGRDKERTVLVELGKLRPFTDIAGLHVIRLVDSSESRQGLAQRLKLAGCPVNLVGTDWHEAGDFEAALASMGHRSPETNAEVEQQMNTEETPSLTEEARDLLIEAAMDTAGMIVMIRSFGGLRISTNGKAFGERGNIRSEARWKQAIKELLNQGFIEDVKGKGEVFEVTHMGFDVAESLDTSR